MIRRLLLRHASFLATLARAELDIYLARRARSASPFAAAAEQHRMMRPHPDDALATAHADLQLLRGTVDRQQREIEALRAGSGGAPLSDDDRSRIATIRRWLAPRFGADYLATFDRLLRRAGVS